MTRPWRIAALALTSLFVIAFVVAYLTTPSRPLGRLGFLFVPAPSHGVDVTVSVANHANGATPELTLQLDRGGTTKARLAPISPDEAGRVRLRDPARFGEAGVLAVDRENGIEYILEGYFEGSLGGRIDIVVDGIDSEGRLSGSLRARTSYFGSDEWLPLVAAAGE